MLSRETRLKPAVSLGVFWRCTSTRHHFADLFASILTPEGGSTRCIWLLCSSFAHVSLPTHRWATLLDMFHGRWRGFGAALLVRLVETLLANASRQATSIVNPAASVIGPDDGPSTRATRCRPPEGGTRNGTTIGWERQAVFIGLWVRHLLSRRWHLRSTEVSLHIVEPRRRVFKVGN